MFETHVVVFEHDRLNKAAPTYNDKIVLKVIRMKKKKTIVTSSSLCIRLRLMFCMHVLFLVNLGIQSNFLFYYLPYW